MDIDETLVRELVAAQFPHWADLPVTRVAKPGVDNATLRLGADMSVRLPRFERWIGQVHREQRWLPVLAPRLPLPVPIPLAQGEPSAAYPYPWSVYRWLDGDRADQVPLDLRLAALDLAEFLLALQAIETTDGPPPEWSNGFRGVDLADPRDSPVVANRLESRIAALHGLTDTDALTEVWRAGLAAPAWDRPPVWVHGDPDPGNLLATDGRLSAVIDFGTLAVGDPAVDLIPAWTCFDADSRAVFRERLGVDAATWARGRVWGLSGVLPSPETLAPDHPGSVVAHRKLAGIIADLRG
ncbi:aminoglycoside phosphotransferase family protein [Crossiella cryophila]|uniref:Aminoglycoside phosphotransferase (APT) family kinase protein n=1 Tax=Crossiella cryophila TaxID=43355 RepID=A0A7W7CFU0_9PSEU|nr:aminoglycoside phosphotransferase family protein [Crossiella cryophila]MBB4680399.1 aminoglycoside phosphotransferase (APT) family kinase protein [Crossiella cryophila]